MAEEIQQLDLFGIPMAVNMPTQKKKTVSKLLEAEKFNQPPAPVIIEPEPVVYASEQIIVKIKSKVEVIKREEKIEQKRGRKSFKEIDATVDLIDVPDDITLQKKLYYSISEVASWF